MGNRKTFNDFDAKSIIQKDDYLIGFDVPESGGEKKFRLSDLRDFVHQADVYPLNGSQILPVVNPNAETDATGASVPQGSPDIPFLSGKIFHVLSDDHALIQLPNIKFSSNLNVSCVVVNMTNHKRVEIKTVNQMPALKARGVQEHTSGLSDNTTVTFLKKKYDTAIFYYHGDNWYGYGDLDGPSSMHIKKVYLDYNFTLEDEDKILHFEHKLADREGVRINLPNPGDMKSGTQFFVHNISGQWIEFQVPSGVNFHARAKFLRRKYDDAAVYTDGVDWFATGDLS
jgi:hypothetical protein